MSWESHRAWHLMRPLVYYLREDFVAPRLAIGARALDFSAGLGDLSAYMLECGADSVVATRPELEVPASGDDVIWKGGVAAGNLSSSFESESFDLAVARMVFQFPTWEGDRADPDSMAQEFADILKPGGRLVIAFHQFVTFEQVPSSGPAPSSEALIADDDRKGLHEVIRYLGLPPREGPFGETGFGLKVPMLVTTLHNSGFVIETADHPEPFTMPLDLGPKTDDEVRSLGNRVMELKAGYLSDPEESPYDRPATVRRMLAELSGLFEFSTWPIVRIVARKAE